MIVSARNLLSSFVHDTLGLNHPYLIIGLMFFGFFIMFKKERHHAYLLGLPLIITAIFICIGIYPTFYRTLLFLVPISYIFLSVSLTMLIKNNDKKIKYIGYGLLMLILFHPLQVSIRHLFHDQPVENRELVQLLKDQHPC